MNQPKSQNILDRWIIARLFELETEIIKQMDAYNLAKATDVILPFVDDLSNWYVRRSRRRFWKSDDDGDKNSAYETLYFVQTQLAIVLAPFTPYLSEELFQKLTGGKQAESVHLLDYPKPGKIDQKVLDEMAQTRAIIEEGLMQRMRKSETEEQIKVRQPLGELIYAGEKLSEELEQIIAEEVNVKKVKHGKETKLDKTITDELKQEGNVRELIRHIQNARKDAGLNVDDRIKLRIVGFEIGDWGEEIKKETLATELNTDFEHEYSTEKNIDGQNISILIKKV